MLAGWRNQQLSRNLQIATADQRVRYVRRFLEAVNEYPWRWTPALVDEHSETSGPFVGSRTRR